MDVALDSNILIADPWLRSQSIRALLDFVERTPSRILICDLVEKEVREHIKRKFTEYIERIESAQNQAFRNGVLGIPEFLGTDAIKNTLTSWENNFQKVMNKSVAISVPISNKAFQEAIDRSTERTPPCSNSGNGIRDAIIWLSLLEYCGNRNINRSFAFISSNTRDFAEIDNTTLKKKLIGDSNDYSVDVYYYSNLNEFIKEYAEPIAHVTADWVASHINYSEVEELIREYLGTINDKTILNPSDGLQAEDNFYRGKYIPTESSEVLSLEIKLLDCFVWHFDDEHIETGLEFSVHFKAEGPCIRNPQMSLFDNFEDQLQELHSKSTIRLKLFTNLWFHMSAEIVGSDIKLLTVEDKAII